MPLHGLAATDVATLVADHGGHRGRRRRAPAHRADGGNPLFVTELSRLARDRGRPRCRGGCRAARRRISADGWPGSPSPATTCSPWRRWPAPRPTSSARGGRATAARPAMLDRPRRRRRAAWSGRATGVGLPTRWSATRCSPRCPPYGAARLHLVVAEPLPPVADLDPSRSPRSPTTSTQALPLGDLDRAVAYGAPRRRGRLRRPGLRGGGPRYARASRRCSRPAAHRLPDVAPRVRRGLLRAATWTRRGCRSSRRPSSPASAGTPALARAALGFAAGLSGFEVRLHDQAQIDLLDEALAALPEDDSALRADLLARLSVAVSYTDRARAPDRARRVARSRWPVALGDAARDRARPRRALRRDRRTRRRRAAQEAGEIMPLARGSGTAARAARPAAAGRRPAGESATRGAGGHARFARISDDLGQPLYAWYVPLWEGFTRPRAGDLGIERFIAEVARIGAGRRAATRRCSPS